MGRRTFSFTRAPLLVALVVPAVVAVLAVSTARADSTPVGPLPAGPVSTVRTEPGQFVAVALPRQRASSGLVWRLARNVNPKVARQVAEADVGSTVVVVFEVVGRGRASLVFALTRGESSRKALRSQTTRIEAT